MKPDLFIRTALLPAFDLLPVEMRSPAAMAMVVAICLQESGLAARRQSGGPARGYAQFERPGVGGVLSHPATRDYVAYACDQLDINPDSFSIYTAIEFNDVLACVMARLLLWTLPGSLPAPDDPEKGWQQYTAAWRPGKPRREPWDRNFEQAWQAVAAATRGV